MVGGRGSTLAAVLTAMLLVTSAISVGVVAGTGSHAASEEAVSESTAMERPLFSDDPEPSLSVDVPSEVTVGEPIEIDVEAVNDGGDAGPWSTVTISSPSLDTADDDAFDLVETNAEYGDTFAAGDTIWTSDQEQIDAEYALAEAGTDGDTEWRGGERRSLTTEVVPDEPGTVDIYVRATFTDPDDSSASYADPERGDAVDQQGYEVFRYSVDVVEEPPDPDPALSVDVPSDGTVGEPIEITVEGVNYGGDAGPWSTVTVSSPSFDTAGDDAFDLVETNAEYGDTFAAGDTIWTGDQESTTASYAAVEAGTDGDTAWSADERRSFTAEVTPEEPGTIDLYVRTTLTDPDDSPRSYTAPERGDTVDQQGYEVTRYSISIDEPEEDDTHGLDVDFDGSVGSVELAPPHRSFADGVDEEFADGTDVTLTADPDPGYAFDRWQGDVPSGATTDETVTVTMDRDRSVVALFEEATSEHDLTVEADGGGAVGVLPPGTSAQFVERSYEDGTDVELTARPDAGYEFEGWDGDVPSDATTDETVTVTMDGDQSLLARFDEAAADAEITDIEFHEETTAPDETVEFDIHLTNTGEESREFFVEHTIVGPDGEVADDAQTETIGPDGTEMAPFEWFVEAGTAPGSYDVIVTVWDVDDLESPVAETRSDDVIEVDDPVETRIDWVEAPPEEVDHDGSVEISATGELTDDGEICLLAEGRIWDDEIACTSMPSGEFTYNYTIDVEDELSIDPGDTASLYVEATDQDGDDATPSVDVEARTVEELTVRVVDERGTPVPEYNVRLYSTGETDVTDEDGEVVFDGEVESGQLIVAYTEGDGLNEYFSQTDRSERTVEIEVSASERISGTVYGPDGEPIDGGELTVFADRNLVSTSIDDDGTFSLDEPISPGEHVVEITTDEQLWHATVTVRPGADEHDVEIAERDRSATNVMRGAIYGDPGFHNGVYDEGYELEYFVGWMGGAATPGAGIPADVRDLVSAADRGDTVDTSLTALSLFGTVGSVPKVVDKTQDFLTRYPTHRGDLGTIISQSRVIPEDAKTAILRDGVYRNSYSDLQRAGLDESEINRMAASGTNLRDANRLVDDGADPQVVTRISDDGADLGSIRVGSDVTDSDIDVVLRDGTLSESRFITNDDGRTVWLESGDGDTGLQHIVDGHEGDFINKFDHIDSTNSEEEIVRTIQNTIENGQATPVSDSRGGWEYVHRSSSGDTQVVVSENGYVITAHPLSD